MPGANLEHGGSTIRMARRVSFSSAHLYKQNKFSLQQNKDIFGRCFTPHGHGHNYTVEAFFEGQINAQTGMLINLIDIDRVMKSVTDPLDHQHLNFDIPYFKDVVPTTEVIAQYLFREMNMILNNEFKTTPIKLLKVRLFEMEDLWVEYAEQ